MLICKKPICICARDGIHPRKCMDEQYPPAQHIATTAAVKCLKCGNYNSEDKLLCTKCKNILS